MNLASAQQSFVRRAEIFGILMSLIGIPIRMVEGYRSPERQAQLKGEGTSKAGPGQSAHQFSLAFDYVFVQGGYDVPSTFWKIGDQVARLVGLESLISIGDATHIQLPGWKMWK